MTVEIRQVGPETLESWADVPISFRVESELEVHDVDGGLGGFELVETLVDEPYVKDYDSHEDVPDTQERERGGHQRGTQDDRVPETCIGGAPEVPSRTQVEPQGRALPQAEPDILVDPLRGLGCRFANRGTQLVLGITLISRS